MAKENVEATMEEKKAEKKTVKKEFTEKDIQAIANAADTVEGMGVSEKLSNLLGLARKWNGSDKATLDAAKNACIESFGGSAAMKDYLAVDFEKDVEGLVGIQKLMSTLNTIRSFYARRKTVSRVKYRAVNITTAEGTCVYKVSVEAIEAAKKIEDRDARRKFLLEHPDTVKDTIEDF